MLGMKNISSFKKYTVRHKNTQKIILLQLEEGLSDFNNFLVHIGLFMTQLVIKWPFSFSPHPTSASALRATTWGKQNKRNITFLFNAISLFD